LCSPGEHRFARSRLLRRDAAGKLQQDKSLKSLSQRLQNALVGTIARVEAKFVPLFGE